MAGKTHHKVVALETFFCPVPELKLPLPHTYEILEYARTLRQDQLMQRIRDADILIMTTIKLSAEVLTAEVCPNLKMIGVVASGTDSVDLAACKARGIHVANTPHCNATAVSEHAIASYFAARRSITLSHALARAGEWPKRGSLQKTLDGPNDKPPMTCRSETMGIMGYGAVGKKIESMAKALGMKVLISGRKGGPASEGRTEFDTVVRKSSVIVLCLPRLPETLNLIAEAEFEVMLNYSILVNVSRGGIVDERALVAALRAKRIAGAATDVYFQEPASPENSLLLASDTADLNLVTTPHVAWCAEDTIYNYNESLKENISSWLQGKPTNTVV
ncbi:glycerate dehydrogenase [Xylariales sp. AK1849]|nr:glycerate dehydrogenase [Xylariales sp. AK1849]